MAYCDYLFKRSNGIFYFRHVVKLQGQKRREIRVSLNTRSYIYAKRIAAYISANLKYLLSDGEIFRMNADDLLKELKLQIFDGVDFYNEEDVSRVNKSFSKIEDKVNWVKEHVPDEMEGCSVKEVLALYEKYISVFSQVKKDANAQKCSMSEEDVRAKAHSYYGIENSSSSTAVTPVEKSSNLTIIRLSEMYCSEMLSGGN